MAKHLLLIRSKALNATFYVFLLVITFKCVSSARILVEDDAAPPVPPDAPKVATPTATIGGAAPVTGPTATKPSGSIPAVAHPDHPLSFFMHDILGGSSPSGRLVTGIVANSQANNGFAFSKPNNNAFPINGGVPLVNGNNGLINNKNIPFVTGLGGGSATTGTVIQNTGNNNVVKGSNDLPFVTAGQLPTGATLQKLMFGSVTVIDDELTEGHELGSSVLGRAQGFYLASSLDGSSQTMVLTALFHGVDHHEEDTISFFGVHRTAARESQIAIVGGTGKYENAKGYATVETLHPADQHTTDGVETLLQFNVYLSH